MNELKHLCSMWKRNAKRSLSLIVDSISYDFDLQKGVIESPDWCFEVPYAFKDALDIKYQQRVKNKKKYYVWTQGGLLSFKEGDTLHSKCGKITLQVQHAQPMGWDVDKDQVYLGSVVYKKYSSEKKEYAVEEHSCSQVDFLSLIIHNNHEQKLTQTFVGSSKILDSIGSPSEY